MAEVRSRSLIEALSQYLTTLNTKSRRDQQQELNRFVRWCGRDRGTGELTPPEVGEYAESAGLWGADSAKQLKPVRGFLTYLKTQGLSGISLAPHMKASRPKKGARRAFFKSATDRAELSPEGHKNLVSRLEMLKDERIKVVADIGRAMADKDFKENSPLDAAKERQGFIESGIRDLEGILAHAVITKPQAGKGDKRVRIGRKVTLKDTTSGKRVRYTLVDPRETDPVTGKISNASPVGKALLDRGIGDEVHITVPKGTLHYIIEKVDG